MTVSFKSVSFLKMHKRDKYQPTEPWLVLNPFILNEPIQVSVLFQGVHIYYVSRILGMIR